MTKLERLKRRAQNFLSILSRKKNIQIQKLRPKNLMLIVANEIIEPNLIVDCITLIPSLHIEFIYSFRLTFF